MALASSRNKKLRGVTKSRRLERSERKFAPRVRIQGFHARLRLYDAVALAAEKMDHHPDWSNSWNKVTVDSAPTAPEA